MTQVISKWFLISDVQPPLDGSPLLLWPYNHSSIWEKSSKGEVVLGFYSDRGWFNPEERKTFEPTHWRRLPEPPEETPSYDRQAANAKEPGHE